MASIEAQYASAAMKCPNYNSCGVFNRPETQSSFETCATDPLACMEKQAKGKTFRPPTDKANTTTVDKR